MGQRTQQLPRFKTLWSGYPPGAMACARTARPSSVCRVSGLCPSRAGAVTARGRPNNGPVERLLAYLANPGSARWRPKHRHALTPGGPFAAWDRDFDSTEARAPSSGEPCQAHATTAAVRRQGHNVKTPLWARCLLPFG